MNVKAAKVFSVVGARPQFIKAAVLSRALQRIPALVESIVHSGQHFDGNMSDVFFRELSIPAPAFHLGVQAASHGAMTGRMLEKLEALFVEQRPDIVVVFGDTNTTLAGALAASKLGIPLAHVEAGMRAFERIPEETNRVLTDHMSDLLFSVNRNSTVNLKREGIDERRIVEVGDVMYDCTVAWTEIARQRSTIAEDLGLSRGHYVLCTAHRAGNTDDPARLRVLFAGLTLLAARLPVVFPVHPRTRARAEALGLLERLPTALKLVEPLGYLDMLRLESEAAVITTDSGGVQREAYFHGVPCVTIRDETEWPELVTAGWNVLAPLEDPAELARAVAAAIGTRGHPIDGFGKGDAALRIAARLSEFLEADSACPA